MKKIIRSNVKMVFFTAADLMIRAGTGTWNRPGSTCICSSIPDPKGWGIRSAVVLASLKDNID